MDPSQLDERVCRIERWFAGERTGPVELRLYLTNRCNLSCRFCSYGTFKTRDTPQEELTLQEWLDVLVHLHELGCRHIDINGGEPFLRREDCLAIMERVKELGMTGAVTTNATLLREQDVHRIVECGWDSVQVSLDSASQTVHEHLRGMPGCYGRTVSVLEMFQRLKGSIDSTTPEILVAMVLTRANYRDIPALVQLAINYGCEKFRITPMVEQFEGCAGYQIGDEETAELLSVLENALSLAGNKILTNIGEIHENLSLALARDKFSEVKAQPHQGDADSVRFPVCFEPWCVIRISPLGWVNCCTSDVEKRVSLRDINVKKLWDNITFEDIRVRMKEGRPISACKMCCYAVYADNLKVVKRLRETRPELAAQVIGFIQRGAQGG